MHAGREQGLDFQKLDTYRHIYNYNIDRRHYVAQHHVKYNFGTHLACVAYNLFSVVLVRNILDNLRSNVEFNKKVYDPKRPAHQNFLPGFLDGQSDEKKLQTT